MLVTTRGGVTNTVGGSSATGARVFGDVDYPVRFLMLKAAPVEQEISFDNGATWGVWPLGTSINYPFNYPIPARDILFRPYTNSESAVANGWAEHNYKA